MTLLEPLMSGGDLQRELREGLHEATALEVWADSIVDKSVKVGNSLVPEPCPKAVVLAHMDRAGFSGMHCADRFLAQQHPIVGRLCHYSSAVLQTHDRILDC